MKNLQLIRWVRIQFIRLSSSIAFFPALLAIAFLIFSYILVHFERTEAGHSIKALWPFLDLKDASTARAITGTVAAGILTLTVFSFSMVMIVLNQAAANMSNRLLDLMINNRFQQLILGIYIGTIVYALYVLSTISERTNQVPGISIFILSLLTILDIFLFIYFLHFVTQAVKFDTNIQKIYRETLNALKNHFPEQQAKPASEDIPSGNSTVSLEGGTSGYFQEFRKSRIISYCKSRNWQVRMLILPGNFILEGMPVMKIFSEEEIEREEAEGLLAYLDFYDKQDIAKVPYWGFHQLMEVALKALSPGINDPVTAVRSMNAMVKLLRYRLLHNNEQDYRDDEDKVRIFFRERDAANIARHCLLPVWDYGMNDRTTVNAIHRLSAILVPLCKEEKIKEIFSALHEKAGERLSQFSPGVIPDEQ